MESDAVQNPEDRVAQLMQEPCFCVDTTPSDSPVSMIIQCPRCWEIGELGRLIRDGAGAPELANRVISEAEDR